MTLPSSGPLAISQIAAEFGGAAPHSLSEYYGADAGVPSSGAISISQFYGKSNIFTLTISANSITPNIPALAAAAGWNGSSKLIVNITAALINSLRIEAAWSFPGGLHINIGAGTLVGGVRGLGFNRSISRAPSIGGTALFVRKACTINCLGGIYAGGSGGNTGGLAWVRYSTDPALVQSYGGDGDSGQGFSSSGSLTVVARGGRTLGVKETYSGTVWSPSVAPWAQGGMGGLGGNWGEGSSTSEMGTIGGSYNPSGSGTDPGVSGLPAGNAVDGNSHITWQSTGTLLGGVV